MREGRLGYAGDVLVRPEFRYGQKATRRLAYHCREAAGGRL